MVKTRHSLEVEDSPQQFVSLRRISTRRTKNFGVERFSSGESDAEFEEGMATRRGRSARKCTKRRRIACIEDESADEEHPSLHMRPNSRKVGRTTLNGDSFGLIRRSTRQKKSLYDTLNQKLIIDNAALGLVDVKGDIPAPAATQTRSQRRQAAGQDNQSFGEDGFSDMYSRVKRGRQAMKKDMYGIPIPDQGEETEVSELDGEGEGDNSGEEEEEEDDNKDEDRTENEDESDELPPRRSYFLREHKPRTQIYEAPPIGPQLRRPGKAPAIFQVSTRPIQRKQPRDHQMYRSPARRNSIRRKAAFHGSSSTSSSDSSSSDDENRFQRRKAKSMAKARNRCLPMNLDADDVTGFRKDRARIGSSLADVDPMAVDRSVNFDSVGGLGKHVRALKEMVVFPLLYPEVFQKFKINPPRGVLFYGPPGTGKTLVARALANECSNEDRRVAFFMRKGADCLSKWVGESERQLRLLFDQAYQMRPSIIFFDEIDGLAPVRSSRQDQIHSSIVSTLLALMDGLDSRGEIVVIGATNRIDSIDPALRRPGRFDREFLFPLPSVQARQQILKIHTNAWTPKLLDPFLGELAERCVGYCGADLKALCTEAALLALRRRYPQIYNSAEKLQLDVSSINVSAKDFTGAMQVIVPTAQRSVGAPSRALSSIVAPLLRALLSEVLTLLQSVFPSHLAQAAGVDTSESGTGTADTANKLRVDDFCSDDDENAPCIFEQSASKQKRNPSVQRGFFSFGMSSSACALTHRPRLMLAGSSGQGHTAHLAPAVLHHLERLPVHILDLPAMFACSAKSPEESCAQVFREARRTAPSVVYMPHIDQWWPVLNDTLQATLLMLVEDLDPSAPILLLATADTAYLNLHHTVQELFDNRFGEVISMRNPSADERREYFSDLLQNQATKPPTRKRQAALRALEVLPKAAPPKPRELTQAERKKMEEQEEATNRELRLFLRDALNKIARDRKFNIFAKPVDVEEVPDYYEIVKNPMDLSTMMSKIDLRQYESVKEFLADINLICNNALEYNPDKDPSDRAIRHRACALRDTAQSIMKNELDSDFENLCEEMVESRKRRGAERPKVAPDFYYTKPLQNSQNPGGDNPQSPSRFSKRARGIEAEDYSEFIADKRVRFPRKSITGNKDHVESESNLAVMSAEDKTVTEPLEELPKVVETQNSITQLSQRTEKSLSSGKKIYRKKCVWNYTSRRKRRISHMVNVHRSQQRAKAEAELKGDTTEEEDAEVSFSKSRVDATPEPAMDVMESDVSQETITDITVDVQVTPVHGKSSLSPTVAKISPKTSPKTTSPSGKTPKKTSPTARTELDFSDIKLLNSDATNSGVIDSGLGSSMESNGESMDSVDQLKQQQGHTTDASGTKASSENNEPASIDPSHSQICKEAPSTEITFTPSLRMTRSRSGNKDAQMAVSILEEPEQPLVVDRPRLDRLLAEIVDRTRDNTVEQLCKLYSILSRCVFQHRTEYNKTQLIQDLELSVERYTSQRSRPTLSSSTVQSH